MSSNDEFELSRRKALAGLGAIGVASAGAGLGTTAYFSDEETFENNTLTAGELDLRIDWQQQYFGPEENREDYAPYGSAGYPFVNAHPDHDGDGEQSLDLGDFDEGEFADRDDVVRYTDIEGGANIQEYLTCETLANYDPVDFDNDNRTQERLIELDDVKPGDCGEVTFSYHLCDNPGYVWLTGDLGQVDPALAEAIEVRLWYDISCDNEVREEDKIIFDWGSMADVFGELGNESVQLDPGAYTNEVTDDGIETSDDCPFLGKIEWNGGAHDAGGEFEVEDGGFELSDDDVQDVNDDRGTNYHNVVGFDVGDDEVLLGITFTEFDDGVPKTVDLELVEGNFSPIDGWCFVKVFGGGTCSYYDPSPLCSTGDTGYRVYRHDPDDYAGHWPWGGKWKHKWWKGTNHPAISHIELYYCPAEPDDPSMCFPADETYCLGFEWCLPVDVDVDGIDGIDDINDLQATEAAFDVGFYTEQCRHNDDPSGPPSDD